jgi:ABC-2 type transport system permease protein
MSGGLRRVWLVARREWTQRARTLTFRISTIVAVALVVALIMIPQLFGGGAAPTRTVGLVGSTSTELPAALRATGDRLALHVKTQTFTDEAAGVAALRSGDVAVLLVDQDRLVWEQRADAKLRAVVTAAVQAVQQQRAIDDLGLTPTQAEQLLRPPDIRSTSLEPMTKEESARQDLARIAVVLLFMALSFYGSFVLMGVVEEKSSRVVEVLLSRLRPTELLVGKILGIGLVGLAQFAVVAASALIAFRLSTNTAAPATTPSTMIWIVFWFLLAYAFYSVLYATAGSLVSRQEETQSLSLPIAGFMLVAYILAFIAAESPDGTAAIVGSLFPPTAPMVMIVRIANGTVPWWQIVLSVGLMVFTIYGMIRLAGRIYAGAVLRIGRRLRLREAWTGAEA